MTLATYGLGSLSLLPTYGLGPLLILTEGLLVTPDIGMDNPEDMFDETLNNLLVVIPLGDLTSVATSNLFRIASHKNMILNIPEFSGSFRLPSNVFFSAGRHLWAYRPFGGPIGTIHRTYIVH